MNVIQNVSEAGPYPVELATRYGQLTVPDIESDLIGRFLFRYGEWAWLEAAFAASVIPDGARVLDVGAFAGTFGLGVAQLRALGFLCCVEANPAIVPLLRQNVADKMLCPSLVLEGIVAGPEGRAGAGDSQPGNLGSMSFRLGDDPDVGQTTPAVTLAGLRVEYGRFDLIKLDIEGMELDALRGDENFLAKGDTALWIEANEDPRTIEVARLLLHWGVVLFYFAFPSFNPKNFNGDPNPVFPFAFEAGLLAAPQTPPSLSQELKDAGCILRPIKCAYDIKDALWRTPRWGMSEWEGAATIQELTAVAARSIRGESFARFLAPDGAAARGANATIWEQLDGARAELHAVTERLNLEEEESSRHINQLKAEQQRYGQLEDTLRTTSDLAVERLNLLEAEQLRRERVEKALRTTAELAAERLKQLRAEQLRRERIEESLHTTASLAAGRLEQLEAAKNALTAIRSSTVWRGTAPLRSFVDRQPALRSVLRTLRAAFAALIRRSRRRAKADTTAVLSTPVSDDRAAPDSDHREAIRPLFDSEYYLAVNRDVLEAGIDPLDHFLHQGWREGRAPNSTFDVAYYLATNQDVASAGINPLLHYVWAGQREGRLPCRPQAGGRRCLDAARSPHARAADWTGAIDRSTPLSLVALEVALSEFASGPGIVVSVSHDDYATNYGGIQNMLADEMRTFEAAGWGYLHVSPGAPLPTLADCGPAADYRLRLRLQGRAIGVVWFPDLASVLAASRTRGTKLAFIFHHLLGHIPELLATLPTEADEKPIVWLHDFFTLCPNFTLMRNDTMFCGAPPADSAACMVCAAGAERADQAPRIHAFFETVRPAVLAPSSSTLELWQRRGGYPHAECTVVPLARLTMAAQHDPVATTINARLRVAHVGGASMHKGWHVFEALAFAHAGDPRYEFYHLGCGSTPSSRYIREPVRVGPDQRDAMIEAIVRNRIDVVILWSLWPETFSFTVHEALAGGAFVIARKDAGNVWPAVQASAPWQGCAVDDEAGLFELFENGEVRTLVARANRIRGTLTPGNNSAALLLQDRTEVVALCETGEVRR
jgi:FkbM family methyltransferase